MHMFEFAFFPQGWQEQLSKKVVSERWDYPGGKRWDILYSFMTLTFLRLHKEGKIITDANKGYAAFNTGLFTPSFDYVIAVFSKNRMKGMQEWHLNGFVTWKEKMGGIPLDCLFPNGEPLPAKWFDKPEKLCFHPDYKIDVEMRDAEELENRLLHCLIENANRLPTFLIKKYTSDQNVFDALNDDDPHQRAESIKRSPDFNVLFAGLKGDLIEAIRLAKKKIVCDYAMAVPQYYPTQDLLGHLIPLSFDPQKINEVQCALVVVPYERKGTVIYYQCRTILDLQQAYKDARLLRRPDVAWISPMAEGDVLPGDSCDDISMGFQCGQVVEVVGIEKTVRRTLRGWLADDKSIKVSLPRSVLDELPDHELDAIVECGRARVILETWDQNDGAWIAKLAVGTSVERRIGTVTMVGSLQLNISSQDEDFVAYSTDNPGLENYRRGDSVDFDVATIDGERVAYNLGQANLSCERRPMGACGLEKLRSRPRFVDENQGDMRRGTVSSIGPSFGYIRLDGSDRDIWFPMNALKFDARFGDRVTFDWSTNAKGPIAINVCQE